MTITRTEAATTARDACAVARAETGAKLQNGVEVETCADRHAGGGDCKTAADWMKRHPHGKHPQR